jgi:hypothetical protein
MEDEEQVRRSIIRSEDQQNDASEGEQDDSAQEKVTGTTKNKEKVKHKLNPVIKLLTEEQICNE